MMLIDAHQPFPEMVRPGERSCWSEVRDRSAHGTCVALVLMLLTGWLAQNLSAEPIKPQALPDWAAHARIAGLDLYLEITERELEQQLQALVDQNVSVVEADSNVSYYLTDEEFEAELALMRRVIRSAHRLGLKVAWYSPVLEVLSPHAAADGRSMYRDHPSWVQIGIYGEPNVFYGRKTRVHWVEPDTESAWMSFHTPYVEVLLQRIRKIASTGTNAIWLDVPLFNDIATAWTDLGPEAVAKFQSDTGLQAPRQMDWNDPVWRRWISWRYSEIVQLVDRLADAAKSVSADIVIIIENMTLDHNSSTMLGLDGSNFKNRNNIIQVWEVDVLSDATGMRHAKPDDWISIIAMSKFARAASGKKPSWMFTYGYEETDALLVMAEALASANHPYETKVPHMGTTVGAAFRKRAFAWQKANDARLFGSTSAAKVAIYFSTESRDYVDRAEGTGTYATIDPDDAAWWSNDQPDSVYMRAYLAEYRGMIKWLVRNHVPFDVVVRPEQLELSQYSAIIAPSLTAMSDKDAAVLDRYVENGGCLVLTGPAPVSLDEFGNQRSAPALRLLAQRQWSSASELTAVSSAEGVIIQVPELLGKSYLTDNSPTASSEIATTLAKFLPAQLETNAGGDIHIELRTTAREMLVHLIDPEKLWNDQAPDQRMVFLKLAVRDGSTVTGVHLTSPQRRQTTALPFTAQGNWISFQVPLQAYAMVVLSSRPQ